MEYELTVELKELVFPSQVVKGEKRESNEIIQEGNEVKQEESKPVLPEPVKGLAIVEQEIVPSGMSKGLRGGIGSSQPIRLVLTQGIGGTSKV